MTIERQLADDALLAPLRADGGGFAMLALDQRESLRQMFPGGTATDDELRAFKRTALELLSPHASAVLLDKAFISHEHSAVADARPAELAPDAALILAVDVLVQPVGGAVETTELDRSATVEYIHRVGASALKLLVIWKDDDKTAERRALVDEFLDLARRAGVASLVEGIVRPVSGQWSGPAERHEAIVTAARELAPGATIYKAEVPGYAPGDVSLVEEHAARISEVVDGTWVVLSNGVQQPDFAAALAASVRGGADGFLAGRAVWADTVAETDPAAALAERSVGRLRELAGIVAARA